MKLSRDKIQRMVGSQGAMGGFGGVAGITEQRVHELLQDYVTNDDLTETLEPYATKDWVGSNYLSLSFFNALFQARKADGTTIVSPNNDDTSEIDSIKAMFGFWTDQYISALGQGDDGGAGVGDVTWALLADDTDTRPIALSHLTTALSTYATQSWVQSQGYATTAAVNALEFLNNVTGSNGLVTLSTNKSNSFVVDLTHQHSWFEIQDRPTTLAGFGITDASISNGVITIGTSTITPVTQVAMTMPTGFSVSGSPVTKTGTFAITFATGYEGFTTALKQKIEALYSWFEVDNNGNIKTKDYTENDETKHRGFYSPSFISALGQGDDGTAGVGDVTWALLADSSDTRPIALSHLTTALSTYATQSWVQSQGYATTAAVNALEFLNNVTGGNGFVTLSTNKSNSFVVDLTHQHSWFEIQDRPTTLAGFGITDASISNGVITIGTNTITPVTQVALTMPTGFSVSGSPITKTGTFAITFATGYEGFTTALKQKIEALYSWFEVDNNGNIKTKDYTENDETKHRGFYSPSFISALGQGDDGTAGVGDVTWALLADDTDTRPIALSHLTTALSTYATQTWVQSQGYATQAWVTDTALSGYATQSWVQSQGYATTAAVNALEFLNNVTGGNGLVTLSTNKSNSFVVDLTHQHSWFDIQDKPTTLAGFGITDASISNGVITIGTSTITPVTQVALTMPTGFSVSGSPVTKTGTFAITFATGYEGFTTALKQKIEALYSWFEMDNNGNIKTKDYTENDETKHRGFYSPSFISALGQGDDGTAGVGDVTWALLADDTDTRPIALSHLTTALSTYATQTWVQSQGYATTADVNALEYLINVTGGNGSVMLSTNKANSFIVDLTHQHSWFEIQDRPDTFATYGLSAELSTILGNLKSMIIQGDGNTIGTYTPTSALTVNLVSGTNISISRDATNHTLTIANTYAHPTGGANTTISNANGRVLSSITVNSLGHVTAVGYKTLAMADMPAAMMYYNSISSSNGALTFSGYNISDTVVDLTHQHSWFEIQDRPTTLAGFGVSADDPLLKNNYLTISFFTSLFKAYAGSTEITPNNSTSTVDSIKAMFGFWTSQYISALGQGSDGTSGTGDVTWALLASDDTRPINISHLTGALSGYATQTWVTGTALSGYATQTWVQNQSYATTSTVNALEFLNNVTGGNGSFKLTTNKSNNFVVDLTHQHSWFEIQDRPTTITGLGVTLSASDIPDLSWSKITSGKPTTIAGYGITDAKIQNGVITLGSNTITPITSISRPASGSWFNGTPQIGSDGVMEIGRYIDFHPTTSSTLDYSARIDCGTSTTARTFTLPNSGGTIAITSDIPTVNNSTITIKQTGINDQTFTLNGSNATITLVDTNTWRGMQNNLTTSTSSTSDSLSAYQGYLLANGYARDSTKLPLAGGTTMTGHFSLYGSQTSYTTDSTSYGLDCNNSDIIGINGLFTNDYSEGWTEGINFARSSSGWDSIYAQDGTWYFMANNGTAYATVYCGALYSTGAVTALSDARRKKIASRVNLNIEQVAQMPDIRFTWNDRDDDRMHVGTIAQEWQRILPEVVTDANDTEHTLSMDYGVAALIASICVARKVVDHERRIKRLEQENLELRNELNRLKIA